MLFSIGDIGIAVGAQVVFLNPSFLMRKFLQFFTFVLLRKSHSKIRLGRN